MRIGLYGLPCAGKTTLMNKLKGYELISGGTMLHELGVQVYGRQFGELDLTEKDILRKKAAELLLEKDNYIIDGHYAFGTQPVLPDSETLTYDVSLYLYTDPNVIHERMSESDKNLRFAGYDTASWQLAEIEKIREKCHRLGRDFYVISDGGEHLQAFLAKLENGFSSIKKGYAIADSIISSCMDTNIVLADGDRTVTVMDTEAAFRCPRTHVFDGDYYTGYQTWLHSLEREDIKGEIAALEVRMPIIKHVKSSGSVITSGPEDVWQALGRKFGFSVYSGSEISADTKYFVVKRLQEAGKMVTAYGDSMSDYFMLKAADMGILVPHSDGSISRSLKNRELYGLQIYKE